MTAEEAKAIYGPSYYPGMEKNPPRLIEDDDVIPAMTEEELKAFLVRELGEDQAADALVHMWGGNPDARGDAGRGGESSGG